MNQESREVELFEASAAFWDGESKIVRRGILIAAGFSGDSGFEDIPFNALSKSSRRAIARKIGEVLAK